MAIRDFRDEITCDIFGVLGNEKMNRRYFSAGIMELRG